MGKKKKAAGKSKRESNKQAYQKRQEEKKKKEEEKKKTEAKAEGKFYCFHLFFILTYFGVQRSAVSADMLKSVLLLRAVMKKDKGLRKWILGVRVRSFLLKYNRLHQGRDGTILELVVRLLQVSC